MYAALSNCALNTLHISTLGRAAKARLALSLIHRWQAGKQKKKKTNTPVICVSLRTNSPFVGGGRDGRKWKKNKNIFKTLRQSEKVKASGSSESRQRCGGRCKRKLYHPDWERSVIRGGGHMVAPPRGRRPIRVKRLGNEVSAQCLGPRRLFSTA